MRDNEISHSRKYRTTIYEWQAKNKEYFREYQNSYARKRYCEGRGEILKKRKREKYAYDKEAKRMRDILIDI